MLINQKKLCYTHNIQHHKVGVNPDNQNRQQPHKVLYKSVEGKT